MVYGAVPLDAKALNATVVPTSYTRFEDGDIVTDKGAVVDVTDPKVITAFTPFGGAVLAPMKSMFAVGSDAIDAWADTNAPIEREFTWYDEEPVTTLVPFAQTC